MTDELSARHVDVADMLAMRNRTEQRLARETDPATFRQYRTLALAFESPRDYARPFTDLAFDAEITAPDGTTYPLPGFYDGGRTWRIRYMPYLAGEYAYRTICTDTGNTGLHGQSGRFTVGPAAPDTPMSQHGGHLRVGLNRRHLTYTDGTPFFWLADTWWFVPTDHMPYETSSHPGASSMYQLCVALRKKQRFSFITAGFLGDRPLLRGSGQDEGFHGKDDLYNVDQWPASAVEFWRKVDRYFVYADEAGMGISLNMVWGSDPIAYVKAGRSPGQFLEMLKPVHRYVMARLGSYNLMWHVTAEYNHKEMRDLNLSEVCLKLGRYIRGIDPYKQRAMTIFTWPPHLSNAEDAWAEEWHGFKLTQGGHYPHPWETVPRENLLREFSTPPRKPYVVGEHNFERIFDKKHADDGDVRAGAWLGMMCGSCGFTYGATGLWYPNRDENDIVKWAWGNTPWWNALDYAGARHMTILREFFERFEWTDMQPISDRLELCGKVEPHYARPSAVLLGGKTAVVYLPGALDSAAGVTLKLDRGSYRTWYFNPRTGEGTRPAAADAVDCLRLPRRPDGLDWVFVCER